jgi:hypothetical protein
MNRTVLVRHERRDIEPVEHSHIWGKSIQLTPVASQSGVAVRRQRVTKLFILGTGDGTGMRDRASKLSRDILRPSRLTDLLEDLYDPTTFFGGREVHRAPAGVPFRDIVRQ